MIKTVSIERVQDKPMKNGGTFHILTFEGKEWTSFDKGWVSGAAYEVEIITKPDGRMNVKKIKEVASSNLPLVPSTNEAQKSIVANPYAYELAKYPAFAMRYATDLTIALISKEVVTNVDESKQALEQFFRFIMDKFGAETAPTDEDGFIIE